MAHNFNIKTTKDVEIKPGCWKGTRVEIFDGDKKIGEYLRNYPSHAEKTFYPFEQNGQWYALYSKDYTAVRVMELPSCKDIAGETPNANGFCPVEFYVPKYRVWSHDYKDTNGKTITMTEKIYDNDLDGLEEFNEADPKEHYRECGFMLGCVWQGPYEIHYLDLSKISKGVFIRDSKIIGSPECCDNLSLKESIKMMPNSDYVEIISKNSYKIK